MRHPLRILITSLLVTSCTSVSVIPRYGRLDIGGHVGMHGSGSPSTGTNDLKAIGLEDDTSVPQGRVDLEAGGTHLSLEISDSSHGGSGTLQHSMSDGTNTIPAGTPVNTDFDATLGEAMITWDLVPGNLVEVGIGLGASVCDLNSRFTAPSLTQSVSASQTIPIPVLAVRAGLDLDRFDISALLGGMDAHVDGNDLAFYDLDVMARIKIIGAVGKRIGAFVLGYRYIDLAVDTTSSGKDVDAAVRLSGPYVGLSLGF